MSPNTKEEATNATDLYPINRMGTFTIGPITVVIIPNIFRNTNFSFALMIFVNTLIGNEIAILTVSMSMRILAF